MEGPVVAKAHPSLALIKYWGKRKGKTNIPATPSLAVTLGGLTTTTSVAAAKEDTVLLNGVPQEDSRLLSHLSFLRKKLKTGIRFLVESNNDFPTAAGLASSSSGFAALTAGIAALAGRDLSLSELSPLARAGSASAARALFGGFVYFPAGAEEASRLFPADYWPNLRILVAVVTEHEKKTGSRAAMEISRKSSPFFESWVESSDLLMGEAMDAFQKKDLEKLGDAMRLSYSRMHAVMLGSSPPVRYLMPASVAVLDECALLRKKGVGVWETMDAGPQVKVLCLEKDAAKAVSRIESLPGVGQVITSYPGGDTYVYLK